MISGTPIDCLHIGIEYLRTKNIKADIVISGINHELNYGSTVNYSATVLAAIEANLYNINSISLSTNEFLHDEILINDYACRIVDKILNYYNSKDTSVDFTLSVNLFSENPNRIVLENEDVDFRFILPKIYKKNTDIEFTYEVKYNNSNSNQFSGCMMIGLIDRKNGYYLYANKKNDYES